MEYSNKKRDCDEMITHFVTALSFFFYFLMQSFL